MPIDAIQSIWITPKTRASTSSGTAALDEREPGDVDERVADAHEGERDQRDRDLLPETDGHERDPGDDETAEERGAEPLRTGQRERGDGADERADPDRRVQVARRRPPRGRAARSP